MTNDKLQMTTLGYIEALDGSPLYAAYHPAEGEGPPKLPVVIAPPLFEERKSAYGTLNKLAGRLAAAGHPALRFDYRGSGESGGEPARRRWQHLAEDLATARQALADLARMRDAVLLGLRLGGTLVLQEATRAGGQAVIALAPVVSGVAQVRLWKMRSKIRAELTEPDSGVERASPPAVRGTLDFDGYEVDPAFFDDVAAIDLRKDLGVLSCPGLIVQLSHRTEPSNESVALIGVLRSRAALECLRVEPFWDKVDDVDCSALEDSVMNFLRSI